MTSKPDRKQPPFLSIEDYDRIGFDLTIDLPKESHEKIFYLIVSKHALIRLIMRSEVELNTVSQIRRFLNVICKKLTLSSMGLLEENQCKQEAEGYVLIKDLFVPIVMNAAVNFKLQTSYAFIIKTIMPAEYRGAQKTMKSKAPISHKKNAFDYMHLFIPEKK